MHILLFSSLFPNQANPSLGVFVENRLRHLLQDTNIQATVVAPVPYFPFTADIFGKYATFAKAPKAEKRHGIEIFHPRYFHLPGIGARFQARSLAWAGLKMIKKLIQQGYEFDLIDAHYLYPDGVAASLIADQVDLPFTMTARGSDVTEIMLDAYYGDQIRTAAEKAGQVMTVSESLRRDLITQGVQADKVMTLRNGVDMNIFHPVDHGASRQQLLAECGSQNSDSPKDSFKANFSGKIFLSVGWLIARKRNHLMIEVMRRRPDDLFVMIGDGPERQSLQQKITAYGLQGQIFFLGAKDHHDLKHYLSGADVLTLMSDREGWPNVLLEAMACGTPVLSTHAGGVKEFVNVPEAGRVVDTAAIDDINQQIDDLLNSYPNRRDVSDYAKGYAWTETSLKQKEIFERLSG